ncbi:hypothetical protein EIP91_005523 [Steccherinum ochraceum]|uniref:Cytochrome P450 67 n=1 Tax=Steccherinum ochraceum TaxID=92696 RepID=A0A4V2MXW7_9APHY|nr:hypothetical protein EIP91_005523 [Steccherinum ochraceum]
MLDHNVVVLGGSLFVWRIYKRLEPCSIPATLLLLAAIPACLVAHVKDQYSSIVLAAISVYATFWISLLLFVVQYRISPFHPLAKFPGPFVCKITKIVVANKYRNGEARAFFPEVHDRYGDVVRIGPNELSFRHADAITSILIKEPLPKGPYYVTRVPKDAYQLDGMVDFAQHAQRRKLWNKAVTPAAIKDYAEMLKGVLADLVRAFEERKGEIVDISAWMGYTSIDFMGHMAYSQSFGLLKAGCDILGLLDAQAKGAEAITWMSHIPWIVGPLMKLPPSGPFKVLLELATKLTRDRIVRGASSKDLFHFLHAEDEPEDQRPSEKSVEADGVLAVGAGSDTAATALSHLFYFFMRSPECKRRLQVEIDSTFPAGEETTDFSQQSDSMPYLNACIRPAIEFDYMPPSSFVPEDTQVSVNIPLLHRDPRYFYPLPNEFWPDRFLNQATYVTPSGETITKEQLVHDRSAFLPFSAGPQNCAGRAIALQEVRAVLCAVLQRFDIEKAEGFDLDDWDRNLKDCYVTHRGPLMVKIKHRILSS